MPEHLDNGERVTGDQEFGLISIFLCFSGAFIFPERSKREIESGVGRFLSEFGFELEWERRRSGASINQEGGKSITATQRSPRLFLLLYFFIEEKIGRLDWMLIN